MHLLHKKNMWKDQMREMVEKSLIFTDYFMLILVNFSDFELIPLPPVGHSTVGGNHAGWKPMVWIQFLIQ